MSALPVFSISRVYDVPRERLFELWTDPQLMAGWWGPKGFTVGVSDMDLRPGGSYHYSLKALGGYEMWGLFQYLDVQRPEKLILLGSFSDKERNITRAPFSDTWPLLTLSVFTFEDLGGGQTRLSIESAPHDATEAELRTFEKGLDSMTQGWTGTLQQLGDYLAAAA